MEGNSQQINLYQVVSGKNYPLPLISIGRPGDTASYRFYCIILQEKVELESVHLRALPNEISILDYKLQMSCPKNYVFHPSPRLDGLCALRLPAGENGIRGITLKSAGIG